MFGNKQSGYNNYIDYLSKINSFSVYLSIRRHIRSN